MEFSIAQFFCNIFEDSTELQSLNVLNLYFSRPNRGLISIAKFLKNISLIEVMSGELIILLIRPECLLVLEVPFFFSRRPQFSCRKHEGDQRHFIFHLLSIEGRPSSCLEKTGERKVFYLFHKS